MKQYLLKQRRQATENERRRRDMELELLKAARMKIPVLDRTEAKKKKQCGFRKRRFR